MPHMTTTQLVIIGIIAILAIIPSVMILRRLGFSGWWAIIAPISPLNILGLWIIALVKWPVEEPAKS
jgi:energy-coupling factor transporter transmembrane protein EcfT